MRHRISIFFCLPFFCFGPIRSIAQNSISISSGSSIFISSGTIFTVDSLSLTPSAPFNISGANAQSRDAVILHVSANPHIMRVYHFMNILPAFSGDIVFYYRDAELNGIPENRLALNVNNGVSWSAYTMNAATDDVINSVSVTGITNMVMSELTLANLLAPLPVNFVSVHASCSGNTVIISWTTAQEMNSQHFIIERSTDGGSWQSIGSTPAAGTSNTNLDYTFSDNTAAGTAFYRLKEIDSDGRQTISETIQSRCGTGETVAVYPNPVRDDIFISISTARSGTVMLRLYDAVGKIVRQVQANLLPGANRLSFNMTGLPSGAYMLGAQWGNNNRMIKIIKE